MRYIVGSSGNSILITSDTVTKTAIVGTASVFVRLTGSASVSVTTPSVTYDTNSATWSVSLPNTLMANVADGVVTLRDNDGVIGQSRFAVLPQLATSQNVTDAKNEVLAKLPTSGRAATPGDAMTISDYGSLLAQIRDVVAANGGSGGSVDLTDIATTAQLEAVRDAIRGADGDSLETISDQLDAMVASFAGIFDADDVTAIRDAVIAAIETGLDGSDTSVQAIAVACRDAMLDRVLSTNHEVTGSVGKTLQFLDAAISSVASLDGDGVRAALFHADDVGNRLRVNILGEVSVDSETSGAATQGDVETEVAKVLARLGVPVGADFAADVASIKTDTNSLATRITTARAALLDNLNVGGLVANQASVNGISANTRASIVCPPAVQRPGSGTTTVRVLVNLYDGEGNMEAPDATPTVTAANSSGTDRSSGLSAVAANGTGRYSLTYDVTDAHAFEQIVLMVSVVEGGVTRVYTATLTVNEVGEGGTGGSSPWSSSQVTEVMNEIDQLLSRLTAARGGYLDKLNVAGAIANTNNADAFKATAVTVGGSQATQLSNIHTATVGGSSTLETTKTTVDSVATALTALASKFAGITLLSSWLRAFVRKDSASASAMSEINTGGGTFNETTDSLEALRDNQGTGGGSGTGSGEFAVTIRVEDADEVAIAGATITIRNSSSVIVAVGRTLSGGTSLFALDEATYSVIVSAGNAYLAQTMSVAVAADLTQLVTLAENPDSGTNLIPTGPNYRVDTAVDWVLEFTIGSLQGVDWDELRFTVKRSPTEEEDADAVLQIRLSNPANGASDGLIVLNGGDDTPTAEWGEIEILNTATGSGVIRVKAAATEKIESTDQRFWDDRDDQITSRSPFRLRNAGRPAYLSWDVKRLDGDGNASPNRQEGLLIVSEAVTQSVV